MLDINNLGASSGKGDDNYDDDEDQKYASDKMEEDVGKGGDKDDDDYMDDFDEAKKDEEEERDTVTEPTERALKRQSDHGNLEESAKFNNLDDDEKDEDDGYDDDNQFEESPRPKGAS